MEKLRIFLADDHMVVREGLKSLINAQPDMHVIGEAGDGQTAWQHAQECQPDVVIMDIQLPGISGVECTLQLKSIAPDIQVLVFTVFGDADLVFKALEAGASGYLLKRTPRSEIVDAVKDVWFGGAPMSGEIARKVVESFRKPVKTKDADLEQLTAREEEVLALLAKGYITKEIADQMGISFDTVRFHLKHIYQKLHVRSRSEALIKYLK